MIIWKFDISMDDMDNMGRLYDNIYWRYMDNMDIVVYVSINFSIYVL